MVKLAEIGAFANKVLHEFAAEEYLRHAQALEHAVERHGQLIQAMSRLAAHQTMVAVAASVRDSLTRVSFGVDEARKARATAKQASQ